MGDGQARALSLGPIRPALTARVVGHYNEFRSSRLLFSGHLIVFDQEESTVSLVKIIVITIALILSILLFGRFLF
ncbi:MAG TPA: hypothetical protein VGX92_10445 [Pyrinomonadaceae bacterium]|jgi:hypothetical protein|nr:hypothetical protein [Pyrinomonadaceae bacterium]